MSAFDRVIGYSEIKTELMQICDMIHNKDAYTHLGAEFPHGILLYGKPGLGKTLLAGCFIVECAINTYTLRKNKESAEFIRDITETFRLAKSNTPSIVFLDDMDKFANGDSNHCNSEEYIAIQSGIDEVRDADVFVVATVNDIDKLPDSLLRAGRFDRKTSVERPSDTDSYDIIKHYLSDKKIAADVNLEDVAMMINYSSCAELESIINEAAINAAFTGKESITMADIKAAVLRRNYDACDNFSASPDNLRETALHEAGHLVISEVLCPGSIGMVSLQMNRENTVDGFTRRCKFYKRRPYYILVSLGGKAAVELYFAETCANGCQSDISHAVDDIRTAISESGTCGLGLINSSCTFIGRMSDNSRSSIETAIYSELERYMLKARDIILKNRDFLEKATEALMERKTLLYSDIRALRDSVTITEVAV